MRWFLAIGVSAGVLSLCTTAMADDSAATGAQSVDAADQLAEIVVTAQKRSERLSDVPMSITAATASDLASRGIDNSEQLEKLVPGFSYQKTQFGLPAFFIRGVGFSDTSLAVSPAVTVYTDQVPLPFLVMSRGAVLDLERVEVLKGPQGTLFGQNSTGGAINYIPARPTDALATGVTLTVGRFNQVDAEGFLSGPITDTLSARFAFRHEYRGDWQRSYFDGSTIGAKDFSNARLILDWHPSERMRFNLQVSGWRDTSDTQQPQHVAYAPHDTGPFRRLPVPPILATLPEAPRDPRAAGWTPGDDLSNNNKFYQVALRGDIQLSDAIELSSISAYSHDSSHIPEDIDATPYHVVNVTVTGPIKSFSQELRLAGHPGERLKWMLGANYQDDRIDESTVFNPDIDSGTHVGPFTFNDFAVTNDQKIKTKSVFGSIDFNLTPTLTLQGSARYSRQDRDYHGCSGDDGTGQITTAFSLGFYGNPTVFPPGGCVLISSTTGAPLKIAASSLNQSNVPWRVGLNWKPTDAVLLYANVTKGFKAGSYPTLPAAFDAELVPVPQESLLAYEAGGKVSLLDRRLELEFAGFYYDYRDKQLQGYLTVPPFGNLPALVSIPKARIEGAEINITARPIAGLRLTMGATYLDAKVVDDPVNPTGPFGNLGSFVGDGFPYTPSWQGVADAEYDFRVTPNTTLFLGSTLTARTGTQGVLYTHASPAISAFERMFDVPGYALLDLRGGVDLAQPNLRVELWGRNVTNRFYLTNTVRGGDYVDRFTGMALTYGVTVQYRFGK